MRKNLKRKVYIPETFSIVDLPPQIRHYYDSVAELLHILHHRRLQEQLSKIDFIPLKTQYLNRCLGRNAAKAWIWGIIKPYLIGSVIETDGFYNIGFKSYGYRLIERYRKDKMLYKEINSTHRIVKTPQLPIHKFLVKNLRRIKLHPTWRTISEDILESSCQRIDDGDWYFVDNFKDDFGHRFHSNLTNAPKDIKKFLLVDNLNLVEIDLVNSQPLWAAFEITKRKIAGCENYVRLCSEGKFYDHFLKYGWTREQIKKEFNENIMFKKNGYNSKIKTQFKKDFPEVNRFWEKCKLKDPKNFAKLLQRRESKFIIYTVAESLRRLDRNLFIATIHDSVLCLRHNIELVNKVINEKAKLLNMTLTTKVIDYGKLD